MKTAELAAIEWQNSLEDGQSLRHELSSLVKLIKQRDKEVREAAIRECADMSGAYPEDMRENILKLLTPNP